MIYVIDHKDSFTHNVVHQFQNFDDVECDNFNEINQNKLKKSNVIVFSPGPGSPINYPISSRIYKKFKGKKKIIGTYLTFSNKIRYLKSNGVELYKLDFKNKKKIDEFSESISKKNIITNILGYLVRLIYEYCSFAW